MPVLNFDQARPCYFIGCTLHAIIWVFYLGAKSVRYPQRAKSMYICILYQTPASKNLITRLQYADDILVRTGRTGNINTIHNICHKTYGSLKKLYYTIIRMRQQPYRYQFICNSGKQRFGATKPVLFLIETTFL